MKSGLIAVISFSIRTRIRKLLHCLSLAFFLRLEKLDDFAFRPSQRSDQFSNPRMTFTFLADGRSTQERVPIKSVGWVIKQLIIIPQNGRPPFNVTCMA